MNQIIAFVAQYVVFLLPVLVVVLFLRLTKDVRQQFFITLVLSGVLGLIGIAIASHLFYDPRPFVDGHVVPLFPHASDNGFPSDHMTLGAILAFIGYAYSKKIGLVMIPLALVVGAARVFAHVHSWIDIFGGIVVALIAAIVAVSVGRKVSDKWQSHKNNKTRRTYA